LWVFVAVEQVYGDMNFIYILSKAYTKWSSDCSVIPADRRDSPFLPKNTS
jgi:hypothetical protein